MSALTHSLLPADAIAKLMRAAQSEPSASNPDKRTRAVTTAITEVKLAYPEFFRDDDSFNPAQ